MPPRRPTRPALTRDYIVATALEIIDADGVDGLSMRRLGTRLGADPMAVYHHVPGKAALFDAVVERIWTEVGGQEVPGTRDWHDQARGFAERFRAVLRSHPGAVAIVGTRPVATPAALEVLDRTLGLLTACGLPSQEAIDLANCLAMFVTGHVLAEVGEPVGGTNEHEAPADPARFPNIAAALETGYHHDFDQRFELGLRSLLDGFAAHLAREGRGPGPRPCP